MEKTKKEKIYDFVPIYTWNLINSLNKEIVKKKKKKTN